MKQKRKTNGPLSAVTAEALLKFLFSFAMTAFGILAAYYTTVSGLKLELAGKADAAAVAAMEKKVATVEVQLAERFMTKEDFYRRRDELLARLNKIEAKLEQKTSSGNWFLDLYPNSSLMPFSTKYEFTVYLNSARLPNGR